jgi:hypothetical protein
MNINEEGVLYGFVGQVNMEIATSFRMIFMAK